MSELPPPTPSTAHEANADPNDSDRMAPRRRRLIVVTAVVVTAVLGAGLVALMREDDADDAATAVESWNAIVATQPDSGEVTIYDADGDEIDVVDTGFETVLAVATRGRYALVHESNGDSAVIIDTTEGEITWRGEPSSDQNTIRWLYGTLEPVAADGTPQGGNAIVVDAATGHETDVADAAGIDEPMIVSDNIGVLPGGRYATANDIRGSEVAIVGLQGDGTVVEGLTRSFNSDGVLVVTGRPDEDGHTLSFVVPGESFEVEDGPNVDEVAGARLIDRETAIVITRDGRLLRATAGDPDLTEVAEISLGDDEVIASALSPLPVDRFVATTSADSTIVVDADGNELGRFEGPFRALGGYSTRCVMVDDGETERVVDLETGDEIGSIPGDLSGTRVVWSGDGCTVAFPDDAREQITVVGPSGDAQLDGRDANLAADGSAAIVQGEDRSIAVVDLEDPGADPLVIDAATAAFVSR